MRIVAICGQWVLILLHLDCPFGLWRLDSVIEVLECLNPTSSGLSIRTLCFVVCNYSTTFVLILLHLDCPFRHASQHLVCALTACLNPTSSGLSIRTLE